MENKDTKRRAARKVLYLMLALLVGVVIWYYVDETTGVNGGPRTAEREISGIPIIYTNKDTVLLADRGLMLLEDGTDQTVTMTMQGGRRLVSWLDASRVRVIADLSGVTAAGEQQVDYTYYMDNRFLNGTTVKERPSKVTVNIRELYKKTVDVKCELVGNVAEGYTAGQLQLSHTSIDIWGQESVVSPVAYAKVTLDIGSAEASVSESLEVQFYDKNNQMLDKSGIRTTVKQVQASLPVYVTKVLRLTVNYMETPGIRARNVLPEIKPSTITVSGPAEVLRDRETIELGDFDLASMLDGVSAHTFGIAVPAGCTNLSGVTTATLRVSFLDMMESRVTTGNIRCDNIPEGRTVDILTEQVTVALYGTGTDVGAVTGENIVLVADLADYSAALGGYTIPARVEFGSGGDLGVKGSYQVQVTIREDTGGPDEEEPDSPEEPQEETGE